jgi:hypothetical protein
MRTNRALLNLDAIPSVFDHLIAPVRELHALGISTHAIYERCLPGGPWQRLEPNLVLLTDEPPNRTQLIHAALKAAGKDAVLTGVDALKLHGMSGAKLTSPVHVLTPITRRQPGLVDGAYFERTHQLPEPLHLGGFPVAPLPRATVDTCRRIKHAAFITEVLTETIYKGKITPATLRDELDRVKTTGVTLPRKQLAKIDDQVRSVAQVWAKRLVREAGLPTPSWRVPITTPNGNHVATTDAWWDDVALAWEVDSYAFDLSPTDAVAALARAARLTASGVLVVHTTPTQLRDEPAAVADLLRGAYKRAASRPRPEVQAQCPKPHPTARQKPQLPPEDPTSTPQKPDPAPQDPDPTPQKQDPTQHEADPTPQEHQPTQHETEPTSQDIQPTPQKPETVQQPQTSDSQRPQQATSPEQADTPQSQPTQEPQPPTETQPATWSQSATRTDPTQESQPTTQSQPATPPEPITEPQPAPQSQPATDPKPSPTEPRQPA